MVAVLFMQTPPWQYVKSLAVMSVYSAYEEQTGLLSESGLAIRMPGGSSTDGPDWYPFVMTFNGGRGLANYAGKNISSTILYNFGAYLPFKASSLYLDPESDYYNSFYGAYVVRDLDGGVFGFDGAGNPVVDEIEKIPAYDMKVLVLSSIGCDDPVFESEVLKSWQQDMLGFDDWFVYDASIVTNGAYHRFEKDYRAYIQYGYPKDPDDLAYPPLDFETVGMAGRVYGRYFPEVDASIFFYIIARDDAMIEETEKTFIMKSKIEW